MESISVVFGLACATVIPDFHNNVLKPGLSKAVDAALKKAQVAFGNNPYTIATQDELQKIFIQAFSQAAKSYCIDINRLCKKYPAKDEHGAELKIFLERVEEAIEGVEKESKFLLDNLEGSMKPVLVQLSGSSEQSSQQIVALLTEIFDKWLQSKSEHRDQIKNIHKMLIQQDLRKPKDCFGSQLIAHFRDILFNGNNPRAVEALKLYFLAQIQDIKSTIDQNDKQLLDKLNGIEQKIEMLISNTGQDKIAIECNEGSLKDNKSVDTQIMNWGFKHKKSNSCSEEHYLVGLNCFNQWPAFGNDIPVFIDVTLRARSHESGVEHGFKDVVVKVNNKNSQKLDTYRNINEWMEPKEYPNHCCVELAGNNECIEIVIRANRGVLDGCYDQYDPIVAYAKPRSIEQSKPRLLAELKAHTRERSLRLANGRKIDSAARHAILAILLNKDLEEEELRKDQWITLASYEVEFDRR